MGNETEIKIVRIEVAPGAVVTKYDAGWNKGFQFPIVYTLADGRKFPAWESARLKRDAVRKLAELPREPNDLAACLDADGRLVSTLWSPFGRALPPARGGV